MVEKKTWYHVSITMVSLFCFHVLHVKKNTSDLKNQVDETADHHFKSSRRGEVWSTNTQVNQGNPSCPPQSYVSPSNKGLIAGLIKGNQWVFINPKNSLPAISWGGPALGGGPARIPMSKESLEVVATI